jgi:hypothetical protein
MSGEVNMRCLDWLPAAYGSVASSGSFAQWSATFTKVCEKAGLDEESRVLCLQSRLKEDAKDYFDDKVAAGGTEKFTLTEWVIYLKTCFPESVKTLKKKEHSFRGLMGMVPQKDEGIGEFTARFVAYSNRLSSTVDANREIFIEAVKNVWGDRLSSVMQREGFSKMTVDAIGNAMATLERTFENVYGNIRVNPTVATAPETSLNSIMPTVSHQNPVEKDITMEQLTKELAEMRLMLSKSQRGRDLGKATCFNCDEMGHSARDCNKPYDAERRQRNYEAFVNRKAAIQTDGKGKETMMVMMGAEHKRVRVEDLITDGDIEEVVAKMVPVSQSEGNSKETGSGRRTKASLHYVEKVLDAKITLTVGEFLKLRPSTTRALNEVLSDTKKNVAAVALANKTPVNELSDRPPATSYVMVKVGELDMALFVDVGSSCCIITETLLSRLGLGYSKLEAVELQPAAGLPMQVIGQANLLVQFMEKVTVCITFCVVRECVVPFVLGLDICQILKVKLDYDSSTFSFKYGGEQVLLPIETRSEVIKSTGTTLDNILAEHLLFTRLVRQDHGLTKVDDCEDLLLLVKSKKKELILPPISSFNIDRKIPAENAFEEDICYFDLPGGVPRNFEELVDEKLKGIKHVAPHKVKLLKSLIMKYKVIFPENHMGLPGIKGYEFRIDVDPNAKPISQKMRPLSPLERETTWDHLCAMMKAGIISKCVSPWGFCPVFADKSDGTLRFCVNFKPLNKVTLKDKYPVPLISDLISFVATKKYFSVLDCFAGYWQIKLEMTSRQYAVVKTPFGTYCFNVLPFGLSNAVAYFQSVMEEIFARFLHDFLAIYLDDLCVASMTEEEHLEHLEKVFKVCVKWGVCLKLEKCQFFVGEFRYLGLWISENGIKPDIKKVEALVERKAPVNVKEVRSFVSFASYFRKFIEKYGDMSEPLTRLLKKNARWDWGDEQERAFQDIKMALIKAPLLHHLREDCTLVLSTDASKVAIGAVLEMRLSNGELVPIAYYSRLLLPAERNYMNYEREGLALVEAIKHFRRYLLGRKFVVYTDNSAIAALFREKDPVGRVIRWIHVLMEFDCEIRHRSGKENPVADYFSRIPINILLIVKKINREITFAEILEFLENGVLPKRVRNDKPFRVLIQKYRVVNGELFRIGHFGYVRVLFSLTALQDVLGILHDQLGHFSVKVVWDWVRRRFYRHKLYSEVENYVKSCIPCQEFDLSRPGYKFDGQSEISGFSSVWGLDFLGPFPESQKGFTYICCMINVLTGFPYCEATTDVTSLSAKRVSENMVCLFGIPKSIRCDQGPAFRAEYYKEFCREYGIELDLLPAYTPEWAGFVENLNRVIRYSLAKCCGEDYSQWCSFLPKILLGIRAKVHSRTGYSPFYLTFGVEPNLPLFDKNQKVNSEDVRARLVEVRSLDGLRSTFERDSKSGTVQIKFKIGDLVRVLTVGLRKRGIVDKKKKRYVCPFKVVKVMPHHLYECVDEWGERFVWHVSRLVPFTPRLVDSSLGRAETTALFLFGHDTDHVGIMS